MRTHQKVSSLVADVAASRAEFVGLLETISETDAAFVPAENKWSITDITEHLFWAEQGGLYGMWKMLYAIRNQTSACIFDSEFASWPIDRIIAKTWKEKEQVPASAAPRLGGTLAFWRASLNSLQPVLEAFGQDITDEELRIQAHPHPISGPLDFQQRLEFLSFHIRRHQLQVAAILAQVKQNAGSTL